MAVCQLTTLWPSSFGHPLVPSRAWRLDFSNVYRQLVAAGGGSPNRAAGVVVGTGVPDCIGAPGGSWLLWSVALVSYGSREITVSFRPLTQSGVLWSVVLLAFGSLEITVSFVPLTQCGG
jgi:hypothetical protein